MPEESTDPAGVPDGTVLQSTDGNEVVQERVVNDLDEDGNVVGWHKVPA